MSIADKDMRDRIAALRGTSDSAEIYRAYWPTEEEIDQCMRDRVAMQRGVAQVSANLADYARRVEGQEAGCVVPTQLQEAVEEANECADGGRMQEAALSYTPGEMVEEIERRKREASRPEHRIGLLNDREQTHGSFEITAHVSRALKAACADSPNAIVLADDQREALDMICSKIARILSGNPDEPDHWRDIAGYATLVAERLAPRDPA